MSVLVPMHDVVESGYVAWRNRWRTHLRHYYYRYTQAQTQVMEIDRVRGGRRSGRVW